MNYLTAKKNVKDRAGTKYNGKRLQLIQKLVLGMYNPKDENGDVEKRTVKKKVTTMCGWIGVQQRHLRNLLDSIDEVTVTDWDNGTITYTMNLGPLKDVATLADHTKRQKKASNAARAKRAQQCRAEKRESVTNFLATMIGAAVASGIVPHTIFGGKHDQD